MEHQKINFLGQSRPRKLRKAYTFEDPRFPDESWVLSLAPLDPMEEEAAVEYSSQLTAKYITGGFFWAAEDGGDDKWRENPLPLHAIDGEPIALTERALLVAARLEKMQGHPLPSNGYTAIEILQGSVVRPTAWQGIKTLYWKLLAGEEGWQGKDSPAASGAEFRLPSA